MGALELMRFLEAEFRVRIPDDEITEGNLGWVAGLTRFVLRKQVDSRDRPA